MFNECAFNIQVRYALGERSFEGELFSERTLYYFRAKVTEHMRKTGENLFESVFEKLTEHQLEKFKVKSHIQRMDSTQVSSNIRSYSRLQLLVEVIQRFYRRLSEEEQERYGDHFQPYVKQSSGQYCYHLTSDNLTERMSAIGELLYWIITEFESSHGIGKAYQLLKRVFGDHYHLETGKIETKMGKEISSISLQSPDDEEATHCHKNKKNFKGYVINAAETCPEENELNLLTDVAVAPNSKEDSEFFAEQVPEIAERTDLEMMHTDGSYGSDKNDPLCEELGIELIQSAIRGKKLKEGKLHLSDFRIELDEASGKELITCPNGQAVEVEDGRKEDRRVAVFDHQICNGCPFKEQCNTANRKKGRVLNFSVIDQKRAKRRRKMKAQLASGENPRAAVERLMGLFKHRLRYGKLPVRGIYRVSHYVFATAIMINFSRIAAHIGDFCCHYLANLVILFIHILLGAAIGAFRPNTATKIKFV
jgi:hypothetical protein